MTPLEEDLIRAVTDLQARERRLRELCDEAEEWNRSDKDTWFVLTPELVRSILDGGAS